MEGGVRRKERGEARACWVEQRGPRALPVPAWAGLIPVPDPPTWPPLLHDLRARRALTPSSIVDLHPSPPCLKPPSQSSKRCAPASIRNTCDAHRVSFQSTQFMDKKLFVHLQGGRKVSGTLRGYDLFLNLVIDDALEETNPAQKHPIGTVVSSPATLTCSVCSSRRYSLLSRTGHPRQQRHFDGDPRSDTVMRPMVYWAWSCSV